MENIRLTGSPAALIAADDVEDDGSDEAAPVRLHAEAASDGADDGDDEPEPEQLSPEDKLLRRHYYARLLVTALCFPGK